MKKQLLLLVLVTSATLYAAIPTGYYNAADGKKGEALRSQLKSIISANYNSISYSGLEPHYEQTDMRPNGYIWDMYSTCTFTMSDAGSSQHNVCDCWNKEHSVPQSWFKEQSPMKSDLFHVYPTDARVNNFRGNLPYGETSSTANIDNNSHALGHIGTSSFAGYSGKVYEPDDEYKGDFARTYFYMSTRYMDRDFTKSDMGSVMFENGADLTSYSVALLLKWHRQDPVSQKEIDRNNAVYLKQHNRNPYIDYPYLVEYIWGTMTASNVNMTTDVISSEDVRFIPGVSDGSIQSTDPIIMCATDQITFLPVLAGESSTREISLTGANLSSALTLTITGADAQYFSASETAFADANGTHYVTLTYQPVAVGEHNAVLTLASQGADDVVISLSGRCAAQCNIVWKVDGQNYTAGDPTNMVAVGGRPTILPDAPQSCSTESELFMGWSSSLIDGTTDEAPADLFIESEDAPAVVENTTFYAVFAHQAEGQSSAESDTLIWNSTETVQGWTVSTKKSGTYYVLNTNGYITSPVIDLSRLASVTITARTYGGPTFNTIHISAGNSELGSIVALNKTMNPYTWTNTEALSGESALTFTGTANTDANGPGLQRIEIVTTGVGYTYTRYMTTCSQIPDPTSDIDAVQTVDSAQDTVFKRIVNGHLHIERNGIRYTVLGEKL